MFKVPSVIPGGMRTTTDPGFAAYQAGTFCVMAMAFVASYVYSPGRLLDRVNNNDLYPISLYYHAVRVVIACAAAAIVRHTANVFALETNAVLLLVAFGIGFAPDLFIVAVSRRACQAMKIWGSRADPAPPTCPPGLSLLMIDDLSRVDTVVRDSGPAVRCIRLTGAPLSEIARGDLHCRRICRVGRRTWHDADAEGAIRPPILDT